MSKSKPKKEKQPQKRFAKLRPYLIPSLLALILLVLSFFSYQVFLSDKFYPLTYVGDTNVSLLTQQDATNLIQDKFNLRVEDKLEFSSNQQSFVIDLSTSSAKLDFAPVEDHFNKTHSGNLFQIFTSQLLNLISPLNLSPKASFALENQTEPISKTVTKEPINAQLIFDEVTQEGSTSARIQIEDGSDGLSLDKEKLEKEITSYLLTGKYSNELPLKVVSPKVTTVNVLKAKTALENIQKQPIKLISEESSWTIDTKQLLALLDLTKGEGLLDKEKTQHYIEKLSSEINRDVKEGLFEFNPNTKRVTAFKPSQYGKKLDPDKTFELVTQAVTNQGANIELPVSVTKPKIETSDVNDLGINELLGRGVSHFAGSIPNRIYNVGWTAQKINGVLVPPEEVFSFIHTVGDISSATGFKQAYVIKEGRTVLDDGGGVCQDSTTLFRAVLNAGLPVVKRTAHAYRVGYYEQGFPPGLDATVYYPSVDFQFKNDTAHHILIQAYTAGTTLYIDLYGTADGRVVDLSQPIVTNVTPAPPELRQDDPTLPRGTVKQVDWAAKGATVSFNRTVTRNGETLIKETWKSNYKAWQAVYLVGTQ